MKRHDRERDEAEWKGEKLKRRSRLASEFE